MLNVVVPGKSYTDELHDTPTERNKENLLLALHRSVSDSTLTQGQRPQFMQRPPLEVNVYESEPLTLRCIVEGIPKPIGMAVILANMLFMHCVL